ncbi:hypothetical protein D3C76_1488740 [compost metagenome]
MGAFEGVGPIVNELGVDHFISVRLDDTQWAALWQRALGVQTHHGGRNHEQVRQRRALGLQAATKACGNETTKGKTE